jgi:S1-C subfamily serine protease
VARIIVPEGNVTSFGSGTLVDARDQYGLVVTNWHVVRDSKGIVEVVFPNGFRSHARPLKVDSNWDLAALVIWRPPIEPVKLATEPPRPGDLLTIHGYGRGQYRIATGRCTTYYAPKVNFPQEMVELDVEARQGDSGGPIFNQNGEIAGVLFGAGQGTTLGSFAPRVSNFLASLAPDIGQVQDQAKVAVADRPPPNVEPVKDEYRNGSVDKYPSAPWTPVANNAAPPNNAPATVKLATNSSPSTAAISEQQAKSAAPSDWYGPAKSALALIGLAAIALRLVKLVR